MKSVPSEEEAIRLTHPLTNILADGGFRLTKFLSNRRDVLASLPTEEVCPAVTNLDLDDLPVERTLGVLWNAEKDTLEVKASLKELLPTKRNILSQIATVFDPLGVVAPFILRAKILMQNPWRQSYG